MRSYAESFALLKEQIDLIGDPRPNVSSPPRHDDRELGPSIFRYRAEGLECAGITLPGLFVGRSVLIDVAFSGSDLRLSTFNWSGLTACDFTAADLSGSDLRGCVFEDCSFERSNLSGADLRHSRFRRCSFKGATMVECKLSRRGLLQWLFRNPRLAPEQEAQVVWSDPGPEPEGG